MESQKEKQLCVGKGKGSPDPVWDIPTAETHQRGPATGEVGRDRVSMLT